MKIKVAISNRHIHLTEDACRLLFEKNISKNKDINQPGQFVANETLDIMTNTGVIENVKIVGPFRKYNQIEISRRDARLLGINPPVRESGNLKDAVDIVVKSSMGQYKLKSCVILANRHVHMCKSLADSLRLKNNDEVMINVPGEKGGMLKSYIKVSDKGVLEYHIDTDDANALNLNNGDEVELII